MQWHVRVKRINAQFYRKLAKCPPVIFLHNTINLYKAYKYSNKSVFTMVLYVCTKSFGIKNYQRVPLHAWTVYLWSPHQQPLVMILRPVAQGYRIKQTSDIIYCCTIICVLSCDRMLDLVGFWFFLRYCFQFPPSATIEQSYSTRSGE